MKESEGRNRSPVPTRPEPSGTQRYGLKSLSYFLSMAGSRPLSRLERMSSTVQYVELRASLALA